LTAFAIGAWRVVYEVGLLVAAHLVNLGKVTVGQLDPDRSVGEKIWFAILLIGSVAVLLAGEPLRRFTAESCAAKAGLGPAGLDRYHAGGIRVDRVTGDARQRVLRRDPPGSRRRALAKPRRGPGRSCGRLSENARS
jgi:hypothetical protein